MDGKNPALRSGQHRVGELRQEIDMPNGKMICPKCRDEMNHHADKLIYSSDRSQAAKIDPALDGLIEETHHCPGCGAIALRIAENERSDGNLNPLPRI